MIKKNDLILLAVILVIGIGSFLIMNLSKKEGDKVIVKVDGQVTKELLLNKDTTYEIKTENGGSNILIIEDGFADIVDASCPDKLCVDQHKIQKSGETLVCLPNKVVIEIESDTTSDLDAIAN